MKITKKLTNSLITVVILLVVFTLVYFAFPPFRPVANFIMAQFVKYAKIAFGYLFSPSLESTALLQSIITVEATVLGFLGVFAAYMLSSLDTRIDRFDQEIFKLERLLLTGELTDDIRRTLNR